MTEIERFQRFIKLMIDNAIQDYVYSLGVSSEEVPSLLPLLTSKLDFISLPDGYGYVTPEIEVDTEVEVVGVLVVV